MAIITLHAPGTFAHHIPMGNYINLGTLRPGLLKPKVADARNELRNIISNSRKGSILASDSEVQNTISVYKVGDKPIGDVVSKNDFSVERRAFDSGSYEDVGDGKSIDDLDDNAWNDMDLAEPGQVGIGTRLIMRIPIGPSSYRYFRAIVQGSVGFDQQEYSYAFNGQQTTLQFEELVAGRIITPLGIVEGTDGYDFATSEELPAQYVTKDTSELVWTIRPSNGYFHGANYYYRNFPVIRVDFREFRMVVDGEKRYAKQAPSHPQAWIGSTLQDCRVAQSYFQSTYRIFIRHDIKVSDYTPRLLQISEEEGAGPVESHGYKYDVYLGDGTQLEIRKFDPPIVVDDEL